MADAAFDPKNTVRSFLPLPVIRIIPDVRIQILQSQRMQFH